MGEERPRRSYGRKGGYSRSGGGGSGGGYGRGGGGGRVYVAGKIVGMETPRDVQTKFGPGQVASATLQDESGTVKVTLWNENITKVAVNDTIQIENGYVDSFRGELQLNVGRYGKLAKVESA